MTAKAKINAAQVKTAKEVREMALMGKTVRTIAAITDLKPQVIYNILSRKTYPDIDALPPLTVRGVRHKQAIAVANLLSRLGVATADIAKFLDYHPSYTRKLVTKSPTRYVEMPVEVSPFNASLPRDINREEIKAGHYLCKQITENQCVVRKHNRNSYAVVDIEQLCGHITPDFKAWTRIDDGQ